MGIKMNVNGIGKQTYYGKTSETKAGGKSGGGRFYESLSENINERTEAEQRKENAASLAGAVKNAAYPYCNVAAKAGAANVYESESISTGAAVSCEVRGISYQESDYVKVFAAEGFSLMAQVNAAARSVYIEQKKEDGTIRGYEVNIDKLSKDTADPIEQAALEAWEKKAAEGQEEDELTVEEAMLQFYEFIEDRIKNGPPKYLIGISEFSVAEWDKLIEGIDGQLDAIREELRERIEQMKEEQMKADMSKDLQNLQDSVQETEHEKTEEELLMALFQDMGKI